MSCEGTIQGHFCLSVSHLDDKSVIRTFSLKIIVENNEFTEGKTPFLLVRFFKTKWRESVFAETETAVRGFLLNRCTCLFAGLILNETKSAPKIVLSLLVHLLQLRLPLFIFYNDKLVEHYSDRDCS
jgi:hypothetical protein